MASGIWDEYLPRGPAEVVLSAYVFADETIGYNYIPRAEVFKASFLLVMFFFRIVPLLLLTRAV